MQTNYKLPYKYNQLFKQLVFRTMQRHNKAEYNKPHSSPKHFLTYKKTYAILNKKSAEELMAILDTFKEQLEQQHEAKYNERLAELTQSQDKVDEYFKRQQDLEQVHISLLILEFKYNTKNAIKHLRSLSYEEQEALVNPMLNQLTKHNLTFVGNQSLLDSLTNPSVSEGF